MEITPINPVNMTPVAQVPTPKFQLSVIVITALVTALIVGSSVYFLTKSVKSPVILGPTVSIEATNSPQSPTVSMETTPNNATVKTYKLDTQREPIIFNYPSDWTVSLWKDFVTLDLASLKRCPVTCEESPAVSIELLINTTIVTHAKSVAPGPKSQLEVKIGERTFTQLNFVGARQFVLQRGKDIIVVAINLNTSNNTTTDYSQIVKDVILPSLQ